MVAPFDQWLSLQVICASLSKWIIERHCCVRTYLFIAQQHTFLDFGQQLGITASFVTLRSRTSRRCQRTIGYRKLSYSVYVIIQCVY